MNCDEAKLSNVPGKIYTSAPMARLSSQAHNINNPVLRNIALANLQIEQWKQQASDELIRGTEHFFKSTKDSLVTLSDATGITGTSAESQAARGRMLAGAQALGTLMGPPPEMVQGAYMSGNAQYIAQVEQMQRNQQAAWGQVGNSIATAWTEANARSGPVGAVTMVFTAIGWNVAAGAATGAGAGLAARIAVNVGGKVLQVSAGVGRTIAEVLATAKNPAQAAKGLEEAAAAAKAAGASAYDVEALTAAKDAVLKGPTAPKVPAGDSPVNGAVVATTKNFPYGFKDAAQYQKAMKELEEALAKSGIDDANIGTRGSAVSGESSKGGPFRVEAKPPLPPSDIDVFIESRKLTEGMKTSANIPGFLHPERVMDKFPALRDWSDRWSSILGREITPGGFRPGTVPSNSPTMPFGG